MSDGIIIMLIIKADSHHMSTVSPPPPSSYTSLCFTFSLALSLSIPAKLEPHEVHSTSPVADAGGGGAQQAHAPP